MKKRCISFIRNFSIAVFCTFTAFSHCLFGYASNDDEFITFNTYEAIQAYRYWYLYGLTADSSSSYTDTYVTTGSINLGNVNISLSSNGSIGGSGTSVSSFEGMWHSFVGTGEDTYTLDISAGNIADINPYSGNMSTLSLACSFSNPTTVGGAADAEYQTLTCSDPNFSEGTNYNVNLNTINDAVTITGSRADTYAIFRSTANPNYDAETNSDLSMYSADSFSGSLSFNSSGGLSGSGTISTTTTTTNTNTLKYVLPEMSGSITNPSGTDPNRGFRYYLENGKKFVIAFLYTRNIHRNSFTFNAHILGSDVLIPKNDLFDYIDSRMVLSGYNLLLLESKSNINGEYVNQYFVNIYDQSFFNNNKIIPLFIGQKDYMSDDLYRYLYGKNRIEQAIIDLKGITQNGTLESQQKGQQLDTKTNQMQTQMTTFQNIEDTAGDNMNAALQNINTNPSLISNNKFLMSVDWIRQQYNRLVTNTPFEAVITFCLVFGLGLLLLGKVR